MIAWHYTVASRARLILRDGLILPASVGVPEGERGIVWFSTHPQWEQTANKALQTESGPVPLTAEQTIDYGGGGWRFGRPIAELLAWPELQRQGNVSPAVSESLEAAARDAGADPAHWYGSLVPVPVVACFIQHLGREGWGADKGLA